MRTRARIAILVFTTSLLATPAWGGNWYLGGGLEIVDIGGETGEGVDTGFGPVINFGYRFSPNFAMDFLWGPSKHNDDIIGDDFTYYRFVAGANFILVRTGLTQPYLSMGFTEHAISYDNSGGDLRVGGSSLFFGGGVDYYVDQRNSIDASIRFHSWEGEWEMYGFDIGTTDGTSTVISVCYNYHFLQ